jgi:hypothetical protein
MGVSPVRFVTAVAARKCRPDSDLKRLSPFAANITVITVLWGLVETVIAVIAGARLYRDA